MLSYDKLKLAHTIFALTSIAGFCLRGYWILCLQRPVQGRITKTLPHIIDSLLLAAALGMLYQLKLSPFATSWLTAKIIALLFYIGLGMLALRFGKTRRQRSFAYLLALFTAAYIVSVALTKSPYGFMA
ncbi:SirB2 family protein [Parahaliea sp. F7430]|uniref:SirB2 family protein n=1 Tax=Sediminihaliea albiluteola TaxID=2758564 RepID=A0A7W2TVH3_9GAMM|nr:SirB2 family protein [Sediminihaliea albiluteola]MBA6412648.1 SirB2 family protein [Sediminihaliea albiluteola]